MKKQQQGYRIVDRKDIASSRELSDFLAKEGQLLLPILELIQQAELAVDELIDVAGRATIEAILTISAEQIAGPKQPGKKGVADVGWYGRQNGIVRLSDRKLRVSKPRLRRKNVGRGGEVDIPAYDALQTNHRIGERVIEILMRGVSTRNYKAVLPEMAESVGMSKSSVSRQFAEASAESLEKLMERRFDDLNILVIYIDGLIFGDHHVLAAVGVDADGKKHVLGLRDGASENAEVVKALLEDLVGRGVTPSRRRLFVIDGSKALRKAIDSVFGTSNPVQRCRNHKIKNVLGHLPKEQEDQARSAMRAAYRLQADQGIAKLEQLAAWYERDYPSAAASLREGLQETFTINRMDLPKSLRRCLATTNIIESPFSGVRLRTSRVTNWKNGAMVVRWAATAFMETENNFRRILGYHQLWMLRAYLDEPREGSAVVNTRKAG